MPKWKNFHSQNQIHKFFSLSLNLCPLPPFAPNLRALGFFKDGFELTTSLGGRGRSKSLNHFIISVTIKSTLFFIDPFLALTLIQVVNHYTSPLFPTSCCLTSLTNFNLFEIVELWICQGNNGIIDKHCISQFQNNQEHQRWL